MLPLRITRKIYKTFYGHPIKNESLKFDFENQQASDIIKNNIIENKPLMISRLGSVELRVISKYFLNKYDSKKISHYIKGEIQKYWWNPNDPEIIALAVNAGFFPISKKNIHLFCELMLKDITEIDILGSWIPQESIISSYLSQSIKVPLKDLEPYYHEEPWSCALEGKTVLVVHPFSKSIESQYKKRELLFKNKDTLPKFNLVTIQAVQSIAGNKPKEFNSWFDALEDMKLKISNTQFDIAIIGCGAYGLPLAAHVKRMGKKAIHLGGQTQVMFGIRGKRWEDREFFLDMFNEHWIRPLSEETPTQSNKVEDGCYW